MPYDPLKPGSILCVCCNVSHNEARDLILSGRVTTMDDLKRYGNACLRCQLCEEDCRNVIAMYLRQREASPASDPSA